MSFFQVVILANALKVSGLLWESSAKFMKSAERPLGHEDVPTLPSNMLITGHLIFNIEFGIRSKNNS